MSIVGGSGKVRGKGTCTWQKDKAIKEKLEFDEKGCSVGPNDAHFARYLGGLARDQNVLPLVPIHWPKLPDHTKDTLWRTIKATIDFKPEDEPCMPLIQHNIMERVAKSWRSNKNKLKALHYDTKIGTPGRWVCGDKDVEVGAWHEMVRHWDQEGTTEIAVKNSVNRKELRYNHTTGTKSYARSRAEYLKKHGHEQDHIQFFYDKHTRKDDQNSWIDDVSAQKYDEMQTKLAALANEEGGETTEMRHQAYIAVMGTESRKRARVRVHELGLAENVSSTHRVGGKQYACLLSQFMELDAKYKQQQADSQAQQIQTQQKLLKCEEELTIIKQLIQGQNQGASSSQTLQPAFQISSHPPHMHQQSASSSQPVQQSAFQMALYPPQMYWQQQSMFPPIPYQPNSTSFTGLLMGDATEQEAELLNQYRPSSHQANTHVYGQ